MDKILRRRILVMKGLMERLDATDLGLKERSQGKMDLRTSFDCDMLNFMMYLMDSDGVIEESEAETVNFYLNCNVTAERITAYIEEHNLTTEDYTSEIPLTMQALTDADQTIVDRRDRKRWEQDEKTAREHDYFLDEDDTYVPTSLLLLEIYKDLGEAVIYSNQNVDEFENEGYTAYIEKLKKYMMEKLSMTEEELAQKEELLNEDHTRGRI
ncbi:MAG: hypothetical protein LKJ76_10135 [Lachnospiraceae bacterium]|jgi:hypothetical protein|nr:hypothetical protein [Lachnospiraceae bacterium]